jgi:hypothetical protein
MMPGETGVWLNSRSLRSGVVGLVVDPKGAFRTIRAVLPDFVREKLQAIYSATGLVRGCPDLVVWDPVKTTVRPIEVKCPHWDKPSLEQTQFMSAAETQGIVTAIAEWEFER